MSMKCLMNGLEVNYPCSTVCPLFGDCVSAFEAQRKAKVATNADRIRAMSDEDLAKILGDKCICPPVGECAGMFGDCSKCWLKWLQQPAEEPT